MLHCPAFGISIETLRCEGRSLGSNEAKGAGKVLGAIGASGGSGGQDQTVAEAGAAAFS
jgi:hypothetical protein